MLNRHDILAYAEKTYGTKAEYLWSKFPRYAVLRHKGEGKWFGIIMNATREKLGLQGAGEADILDVKAGENLVNMLRGKPGILPAYHMNKTHWLSLALAPDSSSSDEEILALLDKSHHLTAAA